MTAQEVAHEVGCHYTKVSRIENGKLACTARDFDRFVTVFNIQGDQLVELEGLRLRGAQRVQPWWHVYDDVISVHYGEFLAYEAEAAVALEYQPLFVPGLLQNEPYARAVTGVGFAALGPDQVEPLVDIRLRRQERLREDEPLQLQGIVTEAALRFQVGGTDVMRGQLRHLIEVTALPNVSLNVIPFAAGENGIVTGSFTMFGSGKDTVEAAFTESADGPGFKDDPGTLRRLHRLFRNLSEVTLSSEASRELIVRIEKELS